MINEVSRATDTTSVKTTSAQRRSRVNHISARFTPIQKMARKATEEAAELKDKVPSRNRLRSSNTQRTMCWRMWHRKNRRCSKQFNSTAEEARATAAKEAVESKGREAAVETTPEAENVSGRTVSFRNDDCRQHAE